LTFHFELSCPSGTKKELSKALCAERTGCARRDSRQSNHQIQRGNFYSSLQHTDKPFPFDDSRYWLYSLVFETPSSGAHSRALIPSRPNQPPKWRAGKPKGGRARRNVLSVQPPTYLQCLIKIKSRNLKRPLT